MKLLLLSLALASTVTLAPAAENDSISGQWQIHQNGAGNENDQICTFAQKGTELTGSCSSKTNTVEITGKVDGKDVSWTYRSEINGSPLTMTYHGSLESTTKITGMMHAEEIEIEGYFTGNRSK
jgi:cytoskeletal protein CcmA (bactofilin family)